MRRGAVLLLCLRAAAAQESITWKFDRLESIGGNPTVVEGTPRIIQSPRGPAIEFNGVSDAIFVETHPLAGAEKFTWEVVFRPDAGGKAEQRFFHLQETGTENRMLFEIRIVGSQWCLDAFMFSPTGSRALLDRTKLHPLNRWYAVAMTYDGEWFRNYVDGVEQGAARIRLTPNRAGRTSIGTRINRVDYFSGAIRESRFTRDALLPAKLLRP